MSKIIMTLKKSRGIITAKMPGHNHFPLTVGLDEDCSYGSCRVQIRRNSEHGLHAAIFGIPVPDDPNSQEEHFYNLPLEKDGTYRIVCSTRGDGKRHYYGYLFY